MAKNTMTFTDNRTGKSYEYNIIDGTRGPSVVDISTFYKDSGMFTYDPGYTSTASCESKITFIDGENSELRYRIPIKKRRSIKKGRNSRFKFIPLANIATISLCIFKSLKTFIVVITRANGIRTSILFENSQR